MILGELSEYTLNSNSIIVFGHVLLASRLYDHLWYTKALQMMWSSTYQLQYTLPKTNIAPEKRPFQKEIHLPTIHFQGRKC